MLFLNKEWNKFQYAYIEYTGLLSNLELLQKIAAQSRNLLRRLDKCLEAVKEYCKYFKERNEDTS